MKSYLLALVTLAVGIGGGFVLARATDHPCTDISTLPYLTDDQMRALIEAGVAENSN